MTKIAASQTAVFLLVCELLVMNATADEKPKPGEEDSEIEIAYQEDVVYGRVHGAGLLADIAFPVYPEKQPKLPAIISVHGGRWRGGHKKDKSTIVVQQWAGFGYFAMSID